MKAIPAPPQLAASDVSIENDSSDSDSDDSDEDEGGGILDWDAPLDLPPGVYVMPPTPEPVHA